MTSLVKRRVQVPKRPAVFRPPALCGHSRVFRLRVSAAGVEVALLEGDVVTGAEFDIEVGYFGAVTEHTELGYGYVFQGFEVSADRGASEENGSFRGGGAGNLEVEVRHR